MTAEERTRIQEEARRYVREQGPIPPVALLERVARIVLLESSSRPRPTQTRTAGALAHLSQHDTVVRP